MVDNKLLKKKHILGKYFNTWKALNKSSWIATGVLLLVGTVFMLFYITNVEIDKAEVKVKNLSDTTIFIEFFNITTEHYKNKKKIGIHLKPKQQMVKYVYMPSLYNLNSKIYDVEVLTDANACYGRVDKQKRSLIFVINNLKCEVEL